MPESVIIRPKIASDEQVLAALLSTGAGFEAAGGSAQMLTEAVENGIDSIIEARKRGLASEGHIRVVVDRVSRAIEVHDDGMGFKDPIHIAEKPFESLKRYDPELTGKFARGIQGFRSFCEKLTFLTSRSAVPPAESLPRGNESGRTVRLGFEAGKIEVELTVLPDAEFSDRSVFPTGAVAIYSDWKRGEFDRFRKEVLFSRLQHHFGELIRGGGFRIEVEDTPDFYEIVPVDYSSYGRIDLPRVAVLDPSGTQVIGEIIPELYLMERLRRDRWLYPYLSYKNRPVGDRAICQIEEFDDAGPWGSRYITGFVRCDFCEINELRQALKPGFTRAALYTELLRLEDVLTRLLAKHQKSLFESRMQSQINDLVIELQDFLRRQNVFSFKVARAAGSLTTDEEPANVPMSAEIGSSDATAAAATTGSAAILTEGASVESVPVTLQPDNAGDAMNHQDELGGYGTGDASERHGGPDASGTGSLTDSGQGGYRDEPKALHKARPVEGLVDNGSDLKPPTSRRAKKRRPRGFGLKFHDDEFNDELSWFEPTTSYIIINSGHQRYKAREGEEAGRVKALMEYLAELYIWEISKLAVTAAGRGPEETTDLFLKTKFQFFDERKET